MINKKIGEASVFEFPALDLLDSCLKAVPSIPDAYQKVAAIKTIARCYNRLGMVAKQKRLLSRAEAMVPGISVTKDRNKALREISYEYSRNQQFRKAKAIAGQLEQPDKSKVLLVMANEMMRVDKPFKLSRLLLDIDEGINARKPGFDRSYFLSEAAELMHSLTLKATAVSCLDRALLECGRKMDTFSKVGAFVRIAEVYREIGDIKASTTLLYQVGEITSKKPEMALLEELPEIAEQLAINGQINFAHDLLEKGLRGIKKFPKLTADHRYRTLSRYAISLFRCKRNLQAKEMIEGLLREKRITENPNHLLHVIPAYAEIGSEAWKIMAYLLEEEPVAAKRFSNTDKYDKAKHQLPEHPPGINAETKAMLFPRVAEIFFKQGQISRAKNLLFAAREAVDLKKDPWFGVSMLTNMVLIYARMTEKKT